MKNAGFRASLPPSRRSPDAYVARETGYLYWLNPPGASELGFARRLRERLGCPWHLLLRLLAEEFPEGIEVACSEALNDLQPGEFLERIALRFEKALASSGRGRTGNVFSK